MRSHSHSINFLTHLPGAPLCSEAKPSVQSMAPGLWESHLLGKQTRIHSALVSARRQGWGAGKCRVKNRKHWRKPRECSLHLWSWGQWLNVEAPPQVGQLRRSLDPEGPLGQPRGSGGRQVGEMHRTSRLTGKASRGDWLLPSPGEPLCSLSDSPPSWQPPTSQAPPCSWAKPCTTDPTAPAALPRIMACPLPYSPSPNPGVTPDIPFLPSAHPNHHQVGTPYSMCPVPHLLSSPPCSHRAPGLPRLSLNQTPSLPSQSAPTTPHCRVGSQRAELYFSKFWRLEVEIRMTWSGSAEDYLSGLQTPPSCSCSWERKGEREEGRKAGRQRKRERGSMSLPLLIRAQTPSQGPHPHDLF